jgi:cyclopropane-fatty-acyl-phospholipid synthase
VLGNGSWLFQLVPAVFRLIKPSNDPARALRNASFHYDTSNDLFAAFLSPDMNYSSPIWDPAQPEEPLEAAQLRKVHHLIAKLELSAGDHLLDIGGGWGSLAIAAAREKGCRVTATTLSREQKHLFDGRIIEAGLQHLVECVVCDYRSTPTPPGGYDRVVSVEMVEHVGREHMDEYFASISQMLKPVGGIMVVQGITIINKVRRKTPPTGCYRRRPSGRSSARLIRYFRSSTSSMRTSTTSSSATCFLGGTCRP